MIILQLLFFSFKKKFMNTHPFCFFLLSLKIYSGADLKDTVSTILLLLLLRGCLGLHFQNRFCIIKKVFWKGTSQHAFLNSVFFSDKTLIITFLSNTYLWLSVFWKHNNQVISTKRNHKHPLNLNLFHSNIPKKIKHHDKTI